LTRAADPVPSTPATRLSTSMPGALWATKWKPAFNAFAITFEGRINPAGN
jgi:hypothetical protein